MVMLPTKIGDFEYGKNWI